MANGNSVLKTTLWTILWCLLVGSYGFTLVIAMEAKNTFVANDCKYIANDVQESTKRAELSNDVTRIDTNQKNVMTKLSDLEIKVNSVITAQAVMTNNQEVILNTLKEIKRDIK